MGHKISNVFLYSICQSISELMAITHVIRVIVLLVALCWVENSGLISLSGAVCLGMFAIIGGYTLLCADLLRIFIF
jgi:hypothetical protein